MQISHKSAKIGEISDFWLIFSCKFLLGISQNVDIFPLLAEMIGQKILVPVKLA